MRSERATALFDTLRPEILARLQKAPDPKEALIHFDNFFARLAGGYSSFFALCRQFQNWLSF